MRQIQELRALLSAASFEVVHLRGLLQATQQPAIVPPPTQAEPMDTSAAAMQTQAETARAAGAATVAAQQPQVGQQAGIGVQGPTDMEAEPVASSSADHRQQQQQHQQLIPHQQQQRVTPPGADVLMSDNTGPAAAGLGVGETQSVVSLALGPGPPTGAPDSPPPAVASSILESNIRARLHECGAPLLLIDKAIANVAAVNPGKWRTALKQQPSANGYSVPAAVLKLVTNTLVTLLREQPHGTQEHQCVIAALQRPYEPVGGSTPLKRKISKVAARAAQRVRQAAATAVAAAASVLTPAAAKPAQLAGHTGRQSGSRRHARSHVSHPHEPAAAAAMAAAGTGAH